ncbi:MAG: hypothetical protein NXI24_14230 [bacterium]|nr:hypothetical protein [bacterium]
MEDDVYAAPDSAFESHRLPGEGESFSFMRCLSEGAEAFRRNPGPGILATIVMVVLVGFAYTAILTAFGNFVGVDDIGAALAVVALAFGGLLALFVLYRMLQAGMQILGMNLVRGAGRVEDIFSGFHRAGAVSGGALLTAFIQLIIPFVLSIMLIVLAASSAAVEEQLDDLEAADTGFLIMGTFLAIIVGFKIYLDGRLLLVFPLILERKLGVIAAVVESWRLTAPQQLQLALLTLVTEIGVLIGFFCCGIGALVTTPLHYTVHGSAATLLMGAGSVPGSDESSGDAPKDAGSGDRIGFDQASNAPGIPQRQDTSETDSRRVQNPDDSSPYS